MDFGQIRSELAPPQKEFGDGNSGKGVSQDFIGAVIERWRGATMSHRLPSEDASAEAVSRAKDEVVNAPPTAPVDSDRFRTLKKPLEPQADAAVAQRQLAARRARFPQR